MVLILKIDVRPVWESPALQLGISGAETEPHIFVIPCSFIDRYQSALSLGNEKH